MIYYVDSMNGNDSNSGLSPANAKKSLAPFQYNASRSQPFLRAGDKILLKRGTKYYGFNKFWVGGTGESYQKMCLVGAYGAGENPILSVAKEITANVWTSLGNNIYSVSLTNTANFGGYNGVNPSNGDCNVGSIFDNVNQKLYGNKKFSMADLTEQWDFYVDTTGTLFVYSTENPYTISNNLSVAVQNSTAQAILTLTNNFIYENLTFTQCSGHGIQSASGDGYYNCIIRHCKFINLGGGTWSGSPNTRLGNGVEFYVVGKNIDVHNCFFDNIYDTATTIQGINTAVSNISFRNNIIQNCSQAFEIWVSQQGTAPTGFGLDRCSFINNLCMYSGNGFGFRDNTNMVDLLLPELATGAKSDLLIADNIFFNPYYAFYKTLNLSGLNYTFRNNKFFTKETKLINTAYPFTALQMDSYKQTTGQEQNSVITTFKDEYKDKYYEDVIFMANFEFEQSEFLNRCSSSIDTYEREFELPVKDSASYLLPSNGTLTNKILQRIGNVIFVSFTFTPSQNMNAYTTFASCNNAEYLTLMGGQQGVIGTNSQNIQAFQAGTTLYFQNPNAMTAGTSYTVRGFVMADNISY